MKIKNVFNVVSYIDIFNIMNVITLLEITLYYFLDTFNRVIAVIAKIGAMANYAEVRGNERQLINYLDIFF